MKTLMSHPTMAFMLVVALTLVVGILGYKGFQYFESADKDLLKQVEVLRGKQTKEWEKREQDIESLKASLRKEAVERVAVVSGEWSCQDAKGALKSEWETKIHSLENPEQPVEEFIEFPGSGFSEPPKLVHICIERFASTSGLIKYGPDRPYKDAAGVVIHAKAIKIECKGFVLQVDCGRHSNLCFASGTWIAIGKH